jgi:hypothetical protein
MLPRRLSRRWAPALGALALAIAGCGSSSPSGNGLASKSPDAIVAAAKEAATHAATVHISGSTVSGNRPISLNMELVAGKGAKGHLTVGGLGIDIVEVEHAFYLNGSPAFYRSVAGAAAAQLLQGKWLKAPANSGEFASLAQLTNLTTLLGSSLSSHGTLAKGAETTIGGQRAIPIHDTTRGGTLYVAATGTPYPLEISKSGSEAGTVTFGEWNKPVTLTPPAGAINITQLQNGH